MTTNCRQLKITEAICHCLMPMTVKRQLVTNCQQLKEGYKNSVLRLTFGGRCFSLWHSFGGGLFCRFALSAEFFRKVNQLFRRSIAVQNMRTKQKIQQTRFWNHIPTTDFKVSDVTVMALIRQGVMVIAGKPACFGDTQHIAVGLHFQGKKVLKLLSAFGGIQICPFP